MINLGILVSGNGSNLQAIINEIMAKRLSAIVKIVISNKADVKAIDRAKKHDIPVSIVQANQFSTKEDYDKHLIEILNNNSVDLIILAGFMRLLTPTFIRTFPMRIMNIHPSLLPAFPGLNVQRKAVEYGVKFSGCTVHFVDEGLDTGPIIIQAVVPVYDNDTDEILKKRILEEEYRIYPQAIQLFADGKLEINGRRVIIKDQPRARGVMENPEVNI